MLIASKCMPQGRGLAPVLVRRASTIELDWDTRQKSRFEATDSSGRRLGVFLPRGTQVRGGDVLVAEDGTLIVVKSAPQAVLRVQPHDGDAQHGGFSLLRAAYHLGNRHVALELKPDHLKLEPDPVLADMLRSMGLNVLAQQAAFEPEGGAYAAAHDPHHGHGHTHGQPAAHEHGHGHAHGEHGHDHAEATKHSHVHGPGCGHEH